MTHFTEKKYVPLIINVPLISHIINLLTNSNKSLLRKIIFTLFLKKSKKCFSNWFRHSKCVYNLQGKSKLIISTSLQTSSSGLNFNVNIKKIYLPKNSWNQITYHISRWRGSSGFNNCSSRQVAKRFVRAYENVDGGVKFNQNDAQHLRQELLHTTMKSFRQSILNINPRKTYGYYLSGM